MSSSPPNKKSRIEENKTVVLEGISSSVLSQNETLSSNYNDAKPFKHEVIEGFCEDKFLEQVIDELKQNSKVNFKESDLFRVYQSIDLGNLSDESPLAEKIPSLMKLKSSLYSVEFRSFVEKISGLGPGTLTEQVDCAANCHVKGCHLLCHDDVIGTRKISYILYLTDPDPAWSEDEGGKLELYESVQENGNSKRMVPSVFPSKGILPKFNTLAYFEVTPGESFHSVQEVLGDRPRLSIQGWYHAKEAPSQIENATLQRLKSSAPDENTEGEYTPFQNDGDETVFSDKDRTYLAQYLDETYLKNESIEEICVRFEDESSVRLRHFLNESWASKLKNATSSRDERDKLGKDYSPADYPVGVDSNWKPVGPAHKQRFLEYTGNDDGDEAGALLQHIKTHLLESPPFGRLLKAMTGLGAPIQHRGRVRRFRPGLDYTVAHYGLLEKEAVLDATLCFAAGNGAQCAYDAETGGILGGDDDAVWEEGEVGGFECYIAADEEEGSKEEEADDTYDEEDDSELLSVSVGDNTFSLVYRDPGAMKFVKYVGAAAPSSRWDVTVEYKVDDDEKESAK